MLGLSIEQAKAGFFDRKAVLSDADRKQKKVGGAWGAFTRTVARRSIRARKGTSKEGQPPFSHVGLLRQWILFAWDAARKSTVVGAARLNKPGLAPATLEHGGSTVLLRRKPRRGEPARKTVQIRPRPYMAPAAAKGNAKLPGFIAEAAT